MRSARTENPEQGVGVASAVQALAEPAAVLAGLSACFFDENHARDGTGQSECSRSLDEFTAIEATFG